MALRVKKSGSKIREQPWWLVQGRIDTEHLSEVPVFDYVQAYTRIGAINQLRKSYPRVTRVTAQELGKKFKGGS